MADHCRKQIRHAVVNYIAANAAIVEAVSTARAHPLQSDPLPALLVLTPNEDNDIFNKESDGSRALTLIVEGYAIGAAVEDILDDIAAEVEPLVMAGIPAWVKTAELSSTEIETSGEAVNISGLIRLTFIVSYHANPAAPDTPL